MSSRFLDGTLPANVEHRWHEFLPFLEVPLLERVSSAIRLHIRQALQTQPWDVKHDYGKFKEVQVWLAGLAASNVNIRSIKMSYPGEAMADATRFQNIPVLTILVRHFPSQVNRSALLHPDVPWCDEKCLPLHRAARDGTLEIVKLLLTSPDIDVNAEDDEGLTALHHAVKNRHHAEETLKIVKHLAALPNIKLLDQRTARHYGATLDVYLAATGKKARDLKVERLASPLHSTVNRN